MKVVLQDLTKIFPSRNKNGKEVVAVNKFNFEIPDGKLIGLLGPSGCGKSTTLYMICGLQAPTSGKIFFGDDDVTELSPENRGVGLVFQNYALYPHMTVKQNIMFPLENFKGEDKLTKTEMLERALKVAKLVQIDDLMNRKPNELSGGQQQRVAIARALVKMPRVLLLDEPLSNLDARLRLQTREEIKRIQRETGITTVFVTHDQEEALTMSDKIVVMKDGVIQQIGTPSKVYDEPANAFVADFIGESNILSGTMIKDCCVDISGHKFECVDKGFKYNEPIDVIIRPEDIKIVETTDKQCLVEAEVLTCVFKGDHYQVTALTFGDERNEIIIHDNVKVTEGDKIGLYIKPFDFHIMHKSRLINTLEGVIYEEGVVEMCEGRFPCTSALPENTKVKVSVDFDDVELTDDEEDGIIGATVISSIYKGSYWQCIVRTDTYYDFFVDTDYEWLTNDRVGIKIAPDKLIVEAVEVPDEE